MKYDLSKFPQRLKQARKTKGLSQNKLIELAGIPQACLWKYETGKSLPNTLNLVILAESLGISLDWFCGGNCNESDI